MKNKLRISNSIQSKISIIISIITTSLFAGLAYYNFTTTHSRLTEELYQNAEISVIQMSKNMVNPLWDIDENMAEELIKSKMMEKYVYAVLVKDNKNNIFQGFKRDNEWNHVNIKENIESNRLITGKRDILKDKEKLGSIEIYLTPKFMNEKLRKDMFNTVIAAILLNIILLTILYLIIKKYLIQPVNRIATGLNESAEQVLSASNQISSASQLLAEGTSDQAASLEQASSSLNEISSMTTHNAQNANQADNLMKEVKEIITRANDAMTRLTKSINEINSSSEETSKIIKTIDGIAFQTNLLALNAAVEAARAGESGAGFAVVADEVRNLAMRTAEAAKNTAELIEDTVKKINEGSELVKRTDKAFSEVTGSISRVGELVGGIAVSSDEQNHGIEQINKAVSSIENVVQQSAANAEESASASELMNSQAEVMKSFANELMVLIKGRTRKEDEDSKSLISKKRSSESQNKSIRPEQIIPLSDDDMEDF